MAYPDDPLAVAVEFWNGSSWVDITDKTFVRDGGIFIRRGFPDEGTTPEPSECHLTLDNRTGDFSPRNPSGTYYGKIGRNTPVRVTVDNSVSGPRWAQLTWLDGQQVVGADEAQLDITGDIDIRVDAAMIGWEHGSHLAHKYLPTSDQRSWVFYVDSDGFLVFAWSSDGTSGAVLDATSTIAAGLESGVRKALRVTMDVNDGGGNRVITFYTSDTIDGSWTMLGSAVTDSGTTSIASTSASVYLMRKGFFSGLTFIEERPGRLYSFELRDGIDGTVVADPDFATVAAGATSFSDAAGIAWSLTGFLVGDTNVRIVDPGIRFVGEVSEWPVRWDVSEQDVWTSVTAQGILRRLNQGTAPVRSSQVDATVATGQVIAYWPMEDAAGASSFASVPVSDSGLFGSSVPVAAPPMTYSGTKPDSGENGVGPLLGSDRIPVLAATTKLSGAVPAYTDSFGPSVAAHCIMDVPPSPGWSDNTPIIHISQSTPGSTVATWEVRYKTGGSLQVRALDASGAQLDASGTLAFDIHTVAQLRLTFVVLQNGSDVLWIVYAHFVDDDGVTVDATTASGTFSSLTVTTANQIRIAPTGGLGELAVGHVLVYRLFASGVDLHNGNSALSALVSFAGETAAERAARLCDGDVVGFDFHLIGNSDGTAPMGAQATPSAFIDAYNEAWQADLALAHESRDILGLTFRTRGTLYNQPIALALDYEGAGEIAPDLTPIDDDQRVRNDIEVKRKSGSSYRAVDSTSRMGTQDPPDGVGRYETSVELNLYDDAVLSDVAHWLLHIGTWDEARYPQVVINLTALAAAGKSDLIAAVCALDVGDRIQLTNLPAFAGTPGTVDLMVLGFQETIGHPVEWTVTLNCVPYGPWDIGTYESTTNTKRYDTLGSTLAADVDAGTDTSFEVTIASGYPLWTTTSASWTGLQVEAGGVIWDVVSVSGSSSPQTFTVTAATANGVEKTVPAGTQIRVAPQQRATYGL